MLSARGSPPSFAFWNGHYFVPGALSRSGSASLLLIPLIVIALARIEEIAAVAFGARRAG